MPHAAQWARSFARDIPISPKVFRRRCAPYMVHAAVEGIALACVPEPDEILHNLLTGADPATGKPAPHGPAGVDINCAVIGCTASAPTANSQFPPR